MPTRPKKPALITTAREILAAVRQTIPRLTALFRLLHLTRFATEAMDAVRRQRIRREAPGHRTPLQELAQTIRTDLGASPAGTTLRLRNGAVGGVTTSGQAIRDRARGLPRMRTRTADRFEKLHDETAQTEANTEGNEHGTVDDVSALHTGSLRSYALRLPRG